MALNGLFDITGDSLKISDAIPTQSQLEELGRRLAQYRKHHGLSQDELAQQSGVGVATLRRIEKGQDAQLSNWIKLLRALGASEHLNLLLPEELKSPMAEVKRSRRRTGSAPDRVVWGDEKA